MSFYHYLLALKQASELAAARQQAPELRARSLETCSKEEQEEGDAIAFFLFFFSCNTKKKQHKEKCLPGSYVGPAPVTPRSKFQARSNLQVRSSLPRQAGSKLQARSILQAPSSLPLQVRSKLRARSRSTSLEPGALAME